MSEIQAIELALRRAAARRRRARALRGLWLGLFCGSAAAALLMLAYKLMPLPSITPLFVAVLPLAGLAIGALAGAWRRISLSEAARWVDQHEGLKERLSTALEFSRDTSSKWGDLVLKDAAAHATGLDPRRMVPFHLSSPARWSLLTLALAAGLGFVPEYRSTMYVQKKADAENIQEMGRRLNQFAARSIEQRKPAAEAVRESLTTTAELGQNLEKRTLTKAEALRELASTANRLEARAKELGKDPVIEQMRRAAQSGGGEMSSREALQKRIDALKEQLGTEAAPEKVSQLAQELNKLAQRASAMAANHASPSSMRDDLGAQLQNLGQQAAALGVNIPELDKAIEALAANQTELFLKDLKEASVDMEKLSQLAKNLQALQQQADRLGKNLGEQLKFGQAEAARETLSKLSKALQEGALTPEQLKKMLEEVSGGVKPAANYGELAKFLQSAASQMQAGQNAAASESLQAAAKELEKLLQQFGDAETMMATLEALNQASMAIGTGQCRGLGIRPGYSQGKGPGSGVGTWSDSSGTWDGEPTEMADNSGVNRPDMEARSGEADPKQGDPLTPSRVRGQFSPGSQMPSVSLRGVGIKGQSKVTYEEAAQAAQSAAESALSQDKVPRAYQESVKKYFDEVKEQP